MIYKYKKLLSIICFTVIFAICAMVQFLAMNSSKGVTAQELDIKRYIGLDSYEYRNCSGKDVTVAIIDSGIELHNDIQPKRIKAFKDFVNNKAVPYDDYGHGTFIAGIIGANGKLTGVAPKVNFVIIKVLDKYGETDINTLRSAIKWIIENKGKYNIEVVNISAGITSFQSYYKDSLCQLIKKLKEVGAIIVCAAGNTGSRENTILSPGICPYVLTIGSCRNNHTYNYTDDVVANFSSRGSVKEGVRKPDIVTLGVDIYSLDYRAKDDYVTHSGTSFSTAIITGVSAVLIEKNKGKSLTFIEDIIRRNTIKIGDEDINSQGNGELKLK